MAHHPHPVRIHGRTLRAAPDARMPGSAAGQVRDRALVKHSPTAPEAPFPNARIWLLRARDGFCAWRGTSDAQGHYHATGLEAGVAYVAVGQDPSGQHKAVAAGPVIASPLEASTP